MANKRPANDNLAILVKHGRKAGVRSNFSWKIEHYPSDLANRETQEAAAVMPSRQLRVLTIRFEGEI
jgi:hypothetical protein